VTAPGGDQVWTPEPAGAAAERSTLRHPTRARDQKRDHAAPGQQLDASDRMANAGSFPQRCSECGAGVTAHRSRDRVAFAPL